MTSQQLHEKFKACCFTLSEEDIMAFDSRDNGQINNVIAGLEEHCYGVQLFQDVKGLSVEFFYINGIKTVRGDIIELRIKDPDYFQLLLKFCTLLADDYQDVDALLAFNTFQKKLRTFLEKNGYFTVSSTELERFKGQHLTMAHPNTKGIILLDFIRLDVFYQDFFQNTINQRILEDLNYTYLMVNTHNGLIKIGKAKNPVHREGTLQSKEPIVKLIAFWIGGKALEKELHEKFKAKRVRGEWFRLSIEDLTNLEKYILERPHN